MARNKHRRAESDSDGSIEDVTNGVAKMKVKSKMNGAAKLPVVHDIQLINPNTFDPKKLKLDDEVESGGISRVGLLYKYKGSEKNFHFTCPKTVDAYFKCNGVEEETYAKKGGTRTGTGKNVMKLYMDAENPEHEKFHDCLLSICAIVKKKIEKEKGGEVDVRIRGLYDIVDDAKNVTGHALAARLIESNDGVMYTAAYNDDEQVDVKSVGRCIVRPGLAFSYTIPEDEENYRISVSMTQLYYVARSLFPLRDLE
jgi:hypothetical protein